MTLPRHLEPELLDSLGATDPEAVHSRRDLQRLNWLMGSAAIISAAMADDHGQATKPPQRILELGAGDGHLMLQLAKRHAGRWPGVHLSLLDRQNLVTAQTRADFKRLGWTVELISADVLEWAAQDNAAHWDITIANLFVHHFDSQQIATVFAALSQRTHVFIACEPRRARWPLLASRLVGLIGANAVTRKDAVLSVHAGFRADELSALWPAGAFHWQLQEQAAGLFSHRLVCRYHARSGARRVR